MLNTFYYQLTHTTLKNVELLKHSKINKNAFLFILECFNNSTFFSCARQLVIKSVQHYLMHGVTMKFICSNG